MGPTTRAMFRVVAKTEYTDGYEVKLQPVMGDTPEEKAFWKYTPSGELTMRLVKEETAERFKVGQVFYLDFTPRDLKSA